MSDAPVRGPAQPTVAELEVRPRKVRLVAFVAAVVLVVVFAVLAVLLRGDSTGVYFRLADQVAMVVFGLLLAGAVLLLARPRLRVSSQGVAVRNILGERSFPWPLVREVSFPDGASWARLELPDDEYVAVMAIQATDGPRAVDALVVFRDLHRTYTAAPGPAENRA